MDFYGNPTTVLQLVDLVVCLIAMGFLFVMYKKRKEKSMEHFFYLSLLAIVLILAIILTDVLSVLPEMDWTLLRSFATLVLIVTFIYMLRYLNRTVEAYEEALHLKSGRGRSLRGRE